MRRSDIFWFRKAVPVDLAAGLGRADIRRSLRTGDRRIAARRARAVLAVIEDAFEMLREAGLGPDARAAFEAILNAVMDDFDREGRQVGNRGKYRALVGMLSPSPGSVEAISSATMDQDALWLAEPAPRSNCGPSAAAVDVPNWRGDLRQTLLDLRVKPAARSLLSTQIRPFLEHKNKKLKGNKHLDEVATKLALFIRTAGDKPIHAYTVFDIRAYRDKVDRLPNKARARFHTDDLDQAIVLNEKRRQPFEAITATTVEAKYLSPVRGLFQWLVDSQVIESNPAARITSEQTAEGVLDVEKRLPFTLEQCADLSQLVRKQPEGSIDRWWFPIMRKAGLRLEETGQLTPADFREHNGRLCIDLLHMEDGDPDNAARREALRIKSAAGRRIIPLHRSLIDDGIVAFVEKRRAQDGPLARLFKDELPDRYGNLTTAASKRINRLVDRISDDRRLVGYSARHTFAAACDAAGLPATIRDRFMGHEQGGGDETKRSSRGRHVRYRYGTPIPSPEEMNWIDRLRFD